ncbi:MAG: carbon-nitrogen hydrolase family protein [Planctomycetota bacterium]
MKVAIAQIAPRLLDRVETTNRVVEHVHRAADEGANVVTFGESLVPGYPLWISRTDGARFDAADQKALHARYLNEAVCLERGDLDAVFSAARKREIMVVLGITERPLDRGGHTLYCTCVVIGSDGTIRSAHRKLMPTYEERLAWGPGDGAGLVVHPCGEFTLGALNCWENWMPLARSALHAAGENLHVAIWPASSRLTCDITRFIAMEARSYVISAGVVIRASDVPADFPLRDRICHAGEDEVMYDGGSCIAAPDGSWVIEPQSGTEGLFTAEINLNRVLEARQNFDPSGHYARPDVLRLHVNRTRLRNAVFDDEGDGETSREIDA